MRRWAKTRQKAAALVEEASFVCVTAVNSAAHSADVLVISSVCLRLFRGRPRAVAAKLYLS